MKSLKTAFSGVFKSLGKFVDNVDMRESSVEKRIKEEVEKLGGRCLKWVSPGFTGVPDRIIILPGGRVIFAEIKRPGEKPRPRQRRVAQILSDLGCEVVVLDDPEQLKEVIR